VLVRKECRRLSLGTGTVVSIISSDQTDSSTVRTRAPPCPRTFPMRWTSFFRCLLATRCRWAPPHATGYDSMQFRCVSKDPPFTGPLQLPISYRYVHTVQYGISDQVRPTRVVCKYATKPAKLVPIKNRRDPGLLNGRILKSFNKRKR
jgi:hypothetical protein